MTTDQDRDNLATILAMMEAEATATVTEIDRQKSEIGYARAGHLERASRCQQLIDAIVHMHTVTRPALTAARNEAERMAHALDGELWLGPRIKPMENAK